MKITKTQLKQIIKEELKEYTMAEDPPGQAPPASTGRFDRLFEKGAPGDTFAAAVANQLMLDEESDFQTMVQAIKDGLDGWYSSK